MTSCRLMMLSFLSLFLPADGAFGTAGRNHRSKENKPFFSSRALYRGQVVAYAKYAVRRVLRSMVSAFDYHARIESWVFQISISPNSCDYTDV